MTGSAVKPFEAKLGLLQLILQGGATLLANPILGIKGAGQVVALIQYAGSLFRDIAAGAAELRQINEQIKMLVTENRAPSEAEWGAWESRLTGVDARFSRIAGTL